MSPHFVGRGGLHPPAGVSQLTDSPTPRQTRGRLAPALCVVGAALFLFACGVQGPPLPPRIERPEAVKDLAVSQIGRTLLLTFSLPHLATDGERLNKPLEVRIVRTVYPPGQNAPGGSPENLWTVLQPEDTQRYMQNGKVNFPAKLSDQEFIQWRGAMFTFSVGTLTRGFRRRAIESGPSNTVTARILAVTGAVENLRIQPSEKNLELSWSPPPTNGETSVSPLTGYRVYRSRTSEPGSFELLGETEFPKYSDPNFELDRPVFYKVRIVFKESDQVAESEDSAVAQITPRDLYPPAVPTGLSGIYTGQGVELIWTAIVEPDLAGYNIYRGEADGNFRKVNQESLVTPLFRDSSVEAGHSYHYRVTALDLAGNESAPSEEFTVETRRGAP